MTNYEYRKRQEMNIFPNLKLLRKRPNATPLYTEIVRQARQPDFYNKLGVPDTYNGRFDLIALPAFIIMRRLKSIGKNGEALSQALFDCMFTDIDKNLREMGVGDLSVGKKIKNLASAYYGRIKAYEGGLLETDEFLEAAFKRNIYLDSRPSPKQINTFINYFREQIKESETWSLEKISEVNFVFIPPPNFK